MTASMRNLLWIAALIGFWSVALDWRDASEKLRPERERLEQLKSREQSAMTSVNWQRVAEEALMAQIAWLDRLPEVTRSGVFRAEAMESLADLCQQVEAPCQVAAMGETATATSVNTSPAQPAPAIRGGGGLSTPQDAKDVPGLVTTSVKISTNLGPRLMPLLTALEEGSALRRVDRFTVRSGRAEILVKVYGIDAGVSQALRQGAQRRASDTQAAR